MFVFITLFATAHEIKFFVRKMEIPLQLRNHSRAILLIVTIRTFFDILGLNSGGRMAEENYIKQRKKQEKFSQKIKTARRNAGPLC